MTVGRSTAWDEADATLLRCYQVPTDMILIRGPGNFLKTVSPRPERDQYRLSESVATPSTFFLDHLFTLPYQYSRNPLERCPVRTFMVSLFAREVHPTSGNIPHELRYPFFVRRL